MMESSNLNLDLHHQEDFHGSSSSLAVPWNQDLILNSGDLSNIGANFSSSRDFIMTRVNSEMPLVQDLGFQWGLSGHGEGYMMNNQSSSSQQQANYLPKNIKEELAESFAKLTGINLQDYSSLMMPSHAKQELNPELIQPTHVVGDLGFDGPMNYLGGNGGRGSFSMVLPTANISSSSLQPLFPSNLLGMDLQALDLLAASARFGRTILSQPNSLNNNAAYATLGQLQEPTQAPLSTSYRKASHSVSGVTEVKRSSILDSRTSLPTPAKKPRFESRSSFTPFKVRKEKLGDRIAALQQLVAPFGKTDTASVLMEAIGYIKFLQDQVETLSVPYMRPSGNKKTRASQGASTEERDESKPDLRSRGLCLVPLSCTSYVTNENGGVWSPPNYRGGT